MTTHDMNSEEKELIGALRALGREQKGIGAPDRVEENVLRAWDDVHAGQPRGHGSFSRPLLQLAAVFVLATAASYWYVRREPAPVSPSGDAPVAAVVQSWSFEETVAWLDPEPQALQIVRVGVPSATLAAQGYAVSDTDGDGLIEVEMIVGADGVARSIRVATAIVY